MINLCDKRCDLCGSRSVYLLSSGDPVAASPMEMRPEIGRLERVLFPTRRKGYQVGRGGRAKEEGRHDARPPAIFMESLDEIMQAIANLGYGCGQGRWSGANVGATDEVAKWMARVIVVDEQRVDDFVAATARFVADDVGFVPNPAETFFIAPYLHRGPCREHIVSAAGPRPAAAAPFGH